MTPSARTANGWIAAAAVLAAGTIMALQLLRPPVVGLADNGDYHRVMGYAGFEHSTDDYAARYFSFLRTDYRVLPVGWFRSGYLSSETLLALVARGASAPFRDAARFDLRWLAAVHIALALLALGLLVRATRELALPTQVAAAALIVFFFTDVGYIGPFNSFYSQTASLLFLLLVAAVAADAVRRGALSGWRLAAYFALAAAFVTSKPQEAIQGPVLALLGWRLADGRVRGAWRRPAAWLALALCGVSLWYGRRTPVGLREAALYQVVFYEILPQSPDPAADAAALGLEPEWLRYSGTDAFRRDTPLLESGFRTRFLERVGYKRILGFYLMRPGRFTDRLLRASRKAWTLRPSYGNLERSDEHPSRTLTTRDSAWSRWRQTLFGGWPASALILLLGGNAALALATWRGASPRGRLLREAVLAAVLLTATAFFVCVLTNAPPDFSRVFYSAEALCDLLIVCDLGWLVQTLAGRRQSMISS